MGDGLEKPGGEDCGCSDGLCQGLGGIPSSLPRSKSSNPNPQFSESPFGTALHSSGKHFTYTTACILYNCNTMNTVSYRPLQTISIYLKSYCAKKKLPFSCHLMYSTVLLLHSKHIDMYIVQCPGAFFQMI